jgi:ribosomal protein S2
VNYKWVGGTLTNLNVRDRIESLDKYYKNCNKQLRNRRDFLSFRRYELLFEGLSGLDCSPDLIIIFNLKENKSVVEEAVKANIPVLGFSCGAESFKALTYRIPFDIKNESKLVFLCSFIKECFKNKNIERSRRLKN